MAKPPLSVETLKHAGATRKNIPTAELETVMAAEDKTPIRLAYERRNRDLDPQLVWRGKDEQDWSDLIVAAPPLYIQEKLHPKVIIDDLKRQSQKRAAAQPGAEAPQLDMFADFNGLPDAEAATEFYQHDQHWSNRMISGDSLSVMASLAEREGLRGQVQCIYFDPPYGIKFNSNFQWSTTSRDVKDGAKDHITREPEQVRAFRDTWRDGIHSYLTYLRDRLTVARDLLSESGSIFVQIGDENVHRVRALMDEVFGEENFVAMLTISKTTSSTNEYLSSVADYVVWFAKKKESAKYRQLFKDKTIGADGAGHYSSVLLSDGSRRPASKREKEGEQTLPDGATMYTASDMQSAGMGREKGEGAASWFPVSVEGSVFKPTLQTRWKTSELGMARLQIASRIVPQAKAIRYLRRIDDFAAYTINNIWSDIGGASDKHYVVETAPKIVERCILMATDPGDLVLDPTCGSGTTAYVAEQWGRRWITIDTSRVAIALARARLMGARYPFYLLADSPEGQAKEGTLTRTPPKTAPTQGSVRHGFVYERVPHITLKSIVSNAEIDVIWEARQPAVEAARAALNAALSGHATPFKIETGGRKGAKIDFTAAGEVELPSGEMAPANGFMEWELPREAPGGWPVSAIAGLETFWTARIARQTEIDASIAARADNEFLYDKPYQDKSKVRVAGPFTVESLSPHRVMAVDSDDELVDMLDAAEGKRVPESESEETDFVRMVLDHLKMAGVQQADKADKIDLTAVQAWPGYFIAAEGRFLEGETERRAAIFIGPEYGPVARPDLVAAAREAADAGFDVLIACAFNFDAHSAEFDKLGRVAVLKARMNPDLHMADTLKNTGAGNLFVVFGEPDIDIRTRPDGQLEVEIHGVDVFRPQSGKIESSGPEGIACWFIDDDYNEESFFVRQAYFLGSGDPYKALKTTLKAEIDEEAWSSLNSAVSRPFGKPTSGRIAVKVINHLGDEVMKVFGV